MVARFCLACSLVITAFAQKPAGDARIFATIRGLEQSQKIRGDSADIEAELALDFFLLDQRGLCRESIKKALEIEPNSAQANYLAGRFALESEHSPKIAIGYFQKAAARAPDATKARYYLAVSLRALGQTEAARRELEDVTKSARYSWPFRELAEIELDQNAPALALKAALKAVQLEPHSAANLVVAGKSYQELNLRDEAIQMFLEAEKQDPLADAPHFRLGNLYLEQKQTETKGRRELEIFEELKRKDTPQGREHFTTAERPNGNPQAASREELDAFGEVVEASDPLQTIHYGEDFLSRFPRSEFREKVLELEFEAFRERNDYQAVRRLGAEILAINQWNASILADSAIMIANQNDAGSFGLAQEYASRAVEAANATQHPARLTRAEFFDWKDDTLATAYAAEGTLALRHLESQNAITSLEKAIKLRPSPAGSDYLRLGEAWLLEEDRKSAQQALERAQSLGPPVVAEKAKELASSSGLANGKVSETPEPSGSNPEASVVDKFEHARNLEKASKFEEAAAEYEQVIQADPDLAEAYHNLGLTYYRLRQYSKAKTCLQHALELKPDLAGAHLFLGLSEFRLGEFSLSLQDLQAAIQRDPRNREAYLFLLRDQEALDRFQIETATTTLRLFPHDSDISYTVGLACIERIREIASVANGRGPDSASFKWLSLRRAEEKGDNHTVQHWSQRVADEPEPKLIREYDELAALMRQSFDTVLANDPESRVAHSIEGYIHEAQGDDEQALSDYRQAGNHFAAGRLLAQNVQLQEAEAEFQQAVAEDPENDRAKADLGRLYVQENQCERAVGLLQDVVHRYPEDPYAWADLGKAEGILGHSETAIECLKRALILKPGLNQLHYQLAVLYRKQGRKDLTEAELTTFRMNRSSER